MLKLVSGSSATDASASVPDPVMLAKEIERLATLHPNEFAEARSTSALALGVSLESLDAQVEAVRSQRVIDTADADAVAAEAQASRIKYARFMAKHCVVTMGGQVLFCIRPDSKDVTEVHRFFSEKNFELLYENDFIWVKDKPMPTAIKWRRDKSRAQYDKVVFEPGGAPEDVLNLWCGHAIHPPEGPSGSWNLLRKHILDNICRGDVAHFNWLMTWMADLIQNPGRKKGSSVVVKGKKGVGKTILFDWLRIVIGHRHSAKVTSKRQLIGNFNSHLANSILVVCEEAFWAGDHEAGGTLKDLITSSTMMLEMKFRDAVEVSNHLRLAFISNEAWVVPFGGSDERRYFVLEAGEGRTGDVAFFAALDAEMKAGGSEAMAWELQTWDPSLCGLTWDCLRKPPHTEAAATQARQGLLPHQQFWVELALADGGFRFSGHENDAPRTGGPNGLPVGSLPLNAGTHTAIHAATLRAYYSAYVERHSSNKAEASRQRAQYELVMLDALGVRVRRLLRDNVVGRDDGKTDRTVVLPTPHMMRERLARKGWINADPAVTSDILAEEEAAIADAGAELGRDDTAAEPGDKGLSERVVGDDFAQLLEG